MTIEFQVVQICNVVIAGPLFGSACLCEGDVIIIILSVLYIPRIRFPRPCSGCYNIRYL